MMNELEGMVMAYAMGRLPEDVQVYIGEQKINAYGFEWTIPPGWFVYVESIPQHKVEIPISTIETPAGKIRAGYSAEAKALLLVHVVDEPGYIHPEAIQKGR